MHTKKLAIIIILTLALGCVYLGVFGGYEQCSRHTQVSLSPEKLNNFISSGWQIRLGSNMEEFVKKHGEPQSLKKISINNKFYESQDIGFVVEYSGLIVKALQLSPEAGGSVLPNEVTISSNEWLIGACIRIGDIYEKVISILGANYSENESGMITYENETDRVVLHFINNKLVAVVWYLYVD